VTTAAPLDLERLMADVSKQENLFDYGDPSFVEPLSRMLDAVQSEARLNQAGAMGLELDARRWLVNRLRMRADVTRHPEILDEDVSDPIVIVGVPRTGTTKLQRVLARDPGIQSIPFWQILNPAPFPDAPAGQPDPRLVMARQVVEAMAVYAPDIQELHPFAAEEPEEEIVLLEMTGRALSSVLYFDAPSYTSWLLEQPQQPLYEELRALLQYLQWQDGGRKGRPWVLKSPMHLGRINALLDVFPRATLVHCHRELTTTMTSTCNLVAAARLARTDTLDPLALGTFMLEWCSREWNANIEQRAHLGSDTAVLDIEYTAIHDDILGVVRSIRRARGDAAPSAEAEAAMLAWEDSHSARSGPYRHSADHYGLDPDRIRDAFATYLDHFSALISTPVGASPER
jgi:hypothetical protein